MYIVLAKGRELTGIDSLRSDVGQTLSELTATDEGERVYVLRRPLKRD